MGVLAHLLFFGPFFGTFWRNRGATSLGAFFTLLRAPCYSLGVLAHLLFVGLFLGVGPTNGPFWRNRGSLWPGSPVFIPGWRTSGAHPKPPIVYTGALLAHTPSRPSPILGRFWRTCCFLTSMQTWSTILWSSPSMPSCTC